MDQGPNALPIADKVAHSTVRLEVDLKSGDTSTGTGFFFAFPKDGDRNAPAIVSNRYSVANAVKGRFHLTVPKSQGDRFETLLRTVLAAAG